MKSSFEFLFSLKSRTQRESRCQPIGGRGCSSSGTRKLHGFWILWCEESRIVLLICHVYRLINRFREAICRVTNCRQAGSMVDCRRNLVCEVFFYQTRRLTRSRLTAEGIRKEIVEVWSNVRLWQKRRELSCCEILFYDGMNVVQPARSFWEHPPLPQLY